MLKKIAGPLLLLAYCGAATAGCGRADKSRELDSALREVSLFTDELVKRIEEAPGPAAGVDAAHVYLNARRAEIKSRVESIRKIDDAELGAETRRRKLETLSDGVIRVSRLRIQFMDESMTDPAFKSKLDRLVSDYRELIEA